MFKYRIPSFIQKLFSSYTWKVKTKDKLLFLTFDDGPHPEITPWVLAQLQQYQAKASFFCVADNVRKYPQTYAQFWLQTTPLVTILITIKMAGIQKFMNI